MPTIATKIKRTEQRISALQSHLEHLKGQQLHHRIFCAPKAEAAKENLPDSNAIDVVFDGGTSCNIPSKGFGKGYGSYKIGVSAIKRVEFGMGHSCNSAEVRTLVSALQDLSNADPETVKKLHIVIRGDSKITLKWANPKFTDPPKESSTKNFREAITLLRLQVVKFAKVTRIWHPRLESVKLFGHKPVMKALFNTSNLCKPRHEAFRSSEELKVELNSGRFLDLTARVGDKWHYISTFLVGDNSDWKSSIQSDLMKTKEGSKKISKSET